ncbi:MAG: hypothetical protein NVS4B3_09850 [Gemmatimonadaceae bacterium]
MDCRTFHENHVGFVDDVLPGIELAPMERHLQECRACAEYDARVRRSLLVLKNLPMIALSPQFSARLDARLKAIKPLDTAPRYTRPSYGAFFVAAAGVIAASYLVVAFLAALPAEPLRLPPVIASRPAVPLAPVGSPAIVASVPMGMPVWPAVLIAEEAPIHFAGEDLPVVQAVSLDR